MYKNRHTLLVGVCLLIFSPENISAQDGTFSQFFAHPILLNPALTGLNDGLVLGGQFRDQWFRAPVGWRTTALCAECRAEQIGTGVGIFAKNDAEGAGRLTTNSIGLSIAPVIPIWDNAGIHLGLSSSWGERYVDWERLIFSDQIFEYDPDLILDGTPSTAPRTGSVFMASVGAGVAFRGELPFVEKTKGKNTRKKSVFFKNPFLSIGGAVEHLRALGKVEESMFGIAGIRTPIRWTAHASLSCPLPTDWAGSKVKYVNATIYARAQGQGRLQQYSAGLEGEFNRFHAGTLVHWGQRYSGLNAPGALQFGVMSGYEFKTNSNERFLLLNLGYDFPAGVLGTQTGGAVEVSLHWRFAQKCAINLPFLNPRKKVKCPTFSNSGTKARRQ